MSLDLLLCPKCNGVPVRPEITECKGCYECDFTGTREAYEAARERQWEAFEAWCADVFPKEDADA